MTAQKPASSIGVGYGGFVESRIQINSNNLLRVAITAHLARYKGLSRTHTSSDLQVFLRWCADHHLDPLTVRRADVELFVLRVDCRRLCVPSGRYVRLPLAVLGVAAGAHGLRAHSAAARGWWSAVRPAAGPRLGFRW
jgi:hypothetical protein